MKKLIKYFVFVLLVLLIAGLYYWWTVVRVNNVNNLVNTSGAVVDEQSNRQASVVFVVTWSEAARNYSGSTIDILAQQNGAPVQHCEAKADFTQTAQEVTCTGLPEGKIEFLVGLYVAGDAEIKLEQKASYETSDDGNKLQVTL